MCVWKSEGERERRVRRKKWRVLDKECVVGDGYNSKDSKFLLS